MLTVEVLLNLLNLLPDRDKASWVTFAVCLTPTSVLKSLRNASVVLIIHQFQKNSARHHLNIPFSIKRVMKLINRRITTGFKLQYSSHLWLISRTSIKLQGELSLLNTPSYADQNGWLHQTTSLADRKVCSFWNRKQGTETPGFLLTYKNSNFLSWQVIVFKRGPQSLQYKQKVPTRVE